MTKNREDYIKRIFQFEENSIAVTNKLLAEALDVAPASASQMVTKLANSNLVIVKDGEIKLTEEAILIAKDLVSKHRLWEAFLLDNFGYRWEEVHDDAELLEHATSPFLLAKLNEFLQYPTHCPHGGRIYVNDVDHKLNYVPLSIVKENEKAIIRRFTDDKRLLSYMSENNVDINDEITVTKVDFYNERIHITNNNQDIVLNFKIIDEIFVEKL